MKRLSDQFYNRTKHTTKVCAFLLNYSLQGYRLARIYIK